MPVVIYVELKNGDEAKQFDEIWDAAKKSPIGDLGVKNVIPEIPLYFHFYLPTIKFYIHFLSKEIHGFAQVC
jgi:hypothetical protein